MHWADVYLGALFAIVVIFLVIAAAVLISDEQEERKLRRLRQEAIRQLAEDGIVLSEDDEVEIDDDEEGSLLFDRGIAAVELSLYKVDGHWQTFLKLPNGERIYVPPEQVTGLATRVVGLSDSFIEAVLGRKPVE